MDAHIHNHVTLLLLLGGRVNLVIWMMFVKALDYVIGKVMLALLRDGGFDAVVHVRHDLGNAVIVFIGKHDICYNVDVSFVDPREWALVTAVEVVNIEPVDAYPAVLLPGTTVHRITTAAELGARVVVGLSGVNGEERIIKRTRHHVGGEEVVEKPLFSEPRKIAREDTDGKGAEAVGLVDGHQ